MKKSIALTILTVVLAYFGETTQAAGNIGNPANGSRHSGIGIITGWVCDANEVNLILDYEEYIPVLYGIERKDVRQCDNAGFIALWNGSSIFGNWSSLGAGQHHINAYADGVKFASRTFYVGAIKELGSNIIDASGNFHTIENFPERGEETRIFWNVGLQNFVIVDSTARPPDTPFVDHGTINWSVEPEIKSGGIFGLELKYTRTLQVRSQIEITGHIRMWDAAGQNAVYPYTNVTGTITSLPDEEYLIEITDGFAHWAITVDSTLRGDMTGWSNGEVFFMFREDDITN